MKMKNQISILGGGISGLTAAICLSQKKNITVFEKEKQVGAKINHELQAYKNYDHNAIDAIEELNGLNLKIEPHNEIYKVYKHTGNNIKKQIKSKNPIYYLFLRGNPNLGEKTLESQLKIQAEKLGVSFKFSETINNADIIATGITNPKIFGYGAVFRDVSMENAVYMFYDSKYSPKGYSYALPYKDNRALVSVVTFDKKYASNLEKRFYKLIEKQKVIKSIIKNSEMLMTRFGQISYPNSLPKGSLGRYYIGEAGGFIDPAKGFGLRYAFLSGYLVAKAILEKKDFNKLWKNEIGKDIELGYSRRKIYDKLDDLDMDSILNKFDDSISLKEYEKKRLELEKEISV